MARALVVPLLVFGAVCAVMLWCGLHFTGHPFTWHYALLLAYFPLFTFALLRWQEGSAAQTNVFIRRFMGGLGMKLMASLVVLAVLLKIAPEEVDAPLTIAFAGLYLAFLGFSVSRLSKVIRSARS